MDQSFPPDERLKSPQRISEIYTSGTKLKHSFFLLFSLAGEEEQHRIAFAVPKRKIASAVGRNRIKRKLREIYRLHKEALPEDLPQDFILLYLGSADSDYHKLEKAYLKLWEKWHNAPKV
ncbi:ribonuclease P protein component [Croceimicrobium sp.]|uniref:ribonuclease P protein component n=1 Tax=Croceimicrobium sp. TaxID=2828340 RepID=UPI003BA971A0